MPQRFLKPGIVQSPRFNLCSRDARLLFVALITFVDDYARYDANPLLLARVCFPYGDERGRTLKAEVVQRWLEELRDKDLISLYAHDGTQYLQLKRWTERVRAERPSRFPAPPDSRNGQMSAGAVKCQQPLSNAASPSSSPAASSSPTSTVERERGGEISNFKSQTSNRQRDVEASKLRWGALNKSIKELEGRRDDLTAEERKTLREKKSAIRELEKKQSEGRFE